MEEIAIASVPMQKWEEPYDLDKALKSGNIFPLLHKPFYIEEEMKESEVKPLSACESNLLEIQKVSFYLIDLNLFLDTHPDDENAKLLKKQMQEKYKELKEKFAFEYFPLTIACEGEASDEVAPWCM